MQLKRDRVMRVGCCPLLAELHRSNEAQARALLAAQDDLTAAKERHGTLAAAHAEVQQEKAKLQVAAVFSGLRPTL